MKTKISIENMEFYAFHGCYEQEQIVGNRFLVSLRYTAEVGNAPLTDNIEDTVSYLDVYELVKDEMSKTAHILETVAKRIIDRTLVEYSQILDLEVDISKCNPPLGGFIEKVTVTMSGSR